MDQAIARSQLQTNNNLPPLQPARVENAIDLDDLITRTVQRALVAQQEQSGASLERIESKRKLDKVEFKRDGHKQQFQFCRDVLEKIEDAEELCDEKINEAKEKLSDGKKIIHKRMKLIRLADRESWQAVKEYESDDLASDEEDEKQIYKAVRAANIKLEKMRKIGLIVIVAGVIIIIIPIEMLSRML